MNEKKIVLSNCFVDDIIVFADFLIFTMFFCLYVHVYVYIFFLLNSPVEWRVFFALRYCNFLFSVLFLFRFIIRKFIYGKSKEPYTADPTLDPQEKECETVVSDNQKQFIKNYIRLFMQNWSRNSVFVFVSFGINNGFKVQCDIWSDTF